MADLLKDVEQFLIAAGHATADGTDIFRDNLPDMPDKIIVLTEYGGSGNIGAEALNRSVQVLVRAATYAEAREVSWQLFDTLVDPEAPIKDFTPTRWSVVSGRSTPRKMSVDSRNRISFVFNISVLTSKD